MLVYVRSCANLTCGATFNAALPRQVFCCTKCKSQAEHRKRRERLALLTERTCPRCLRTLAPSDFGAHKTYCRECEREYQREWAARNAGKATEYKRRSTAKAAAKDPDYYRKLTLKKYGLTISRFEEILAMQGGRCASCRTTEPGGRHGTWHVDHDHRCCPRGRSCGTCVCGLLCQGCNIAIGQAHDDAQILRAQAQYVERTRAMRLIT